MDIMYVGKELFVDKPVMPGEMGGRVGRYQGVDVPELLARELLATKDWERANLTYHPEPPDTDDEDELRAAGFEPADFEAAKKVAAEYDTQHSTEVAEADPAVKGNVPPSNPTSIGSTANKKD